MTPTASTATASRPTSGPTSEASGPARDRLFPLVCLAAIGGGGLVLASGVDSLPAMGTVALVVALVRLAWGLGRPAGEQALRAAYLALPAALATGLLLVLTAEGTAEWLPAAVGMALLVRRALSPTSGTRVRPARTPRDPRGAGPASV